MNDFMTNFFSPYISVTAGASGMLSILVRDEINMQYCILFGLFVASFCFGVLGMVRGIFKEH